jgi:hypothetical protein
LYLVQLRIAVRQAEPPAKAGPWQGRPRWCGRVGSAWSVWVPVGFCWVLPGFYGDLGNRKNRTENWLRMNDLLGYPPARVTRAREGPDWANVGGRAQHDGDGKGERDGRDEWVPQRFLGFSSVSLGFEWGSTGLRIWMNRTRKWLLINDFLGSSFGAEVACSPSGRARLSEPPGGGRTGAARWFGWRDILVGRLAVWHGAPPQ